MVFRQQGVLRSCILWTTLERSFPSDVGSGRDLRRFVRFVFTRRLLAPRVSFPLVSACPSEKSSRTVASSLVPSAPSLPQLVEVRHRHVYFRLHPLRRHKRPSIWAPGIHIRVRVFGILHAVDLLRVHRGTSKPTLRSRSPCASWAPPPFGGFVRESHWLSSHCTFLPVRAVQVTATPLLAGPSSHQMVARSFQSIPLWGSGRRLGHRTDLHCSLRRIPPWFFYTSVGSTFGFSVSERCAFGNLAEGSNMPRGTIQASAVSS